MSPTARAKRRLIGGTSFGRWMVVSGSTGVRTYVFDLGDRLEIEERDHWNISRRRIPLRDVVLMTRREVRQIWTMIACLVIAALVGLMAFAIGKGAEAMAGVVTFLIIGAPFLALALLRWLPQSEIQVQSRRVTARMLYGFFSRKRAEALWAELPARVRAAQRLPAAAPPVPATAPGDLLPGETTAPAIADVASADLFIP